jgi:hypothetical protein
VWNPRIPRVPSSLAYILASVLDAYSEVRALQLTSPCLNILSMIASITTPSLIYINVDGQLKFLPLPIFQFEDNQGKVDQCFMYCFQGIK